MLFYKITRYNIDGKIFIILINLAGYIKDEHCGLKDGVDEVSILLYADDNVSGQVRSFKRKQTKTLIILD